MMFSEEEFCLKFRITLGLALISFEFEEVDSPNEESVATPTHLNLILRLN